MRVLFVSPRQSWPAVSGARLRDYHFAKALGARTRLAYVFFSDLAAEIPSKRQFPFCEELAAVPAPVMYTPGKILRGIFGRWPLPVVNYSSKEMAAAIRKIAATGPFDLVHFDSMHMAAYAPLLAGARIVYNWHNIESELMSRYARSATTIAHRMYGKLTASRIAALENDLLATAFGHIVCSQREMDQLKTIAPGARIEVIENGVDVAAFPGAIGRREGRKRLLFVGAMSYHANIDAAVWFTRTLWPEIHSKFPDWKLSLVGSNPSPVVRELQSEDVEVTGTVPSVAPYYEDALAAIVPLRSGSGTRLKILEAMAAGVPVISSTLGAEGLAATPNENILIADREQDWVSALEAICGPRWSELASAGRKLVESRYDWTALGNRLYETYRDWLKSA